MHTVDADTWTRDLGLVESVDRQIGDELQNHSNPALLAYMEQLLLQAENELRIRDLELIKNIDIIDNLYSSLRYRIGRFLIRPMEIIAMSLGLVPKPSKVTKTCVAINVRD